VNCTSTTPARPTYGVLIACPKTFDLVPTRMKAARLDELPARSVLADCPSCGGNHPWTAADAVLALA
jgi:hypothetical protein